MCCFLFPFYYSIVDVYLRPPTTRNEKERERAKNISLNFNFKCRTAYRICVTFWLDFVEIRYLNTDLFRIQLERKKICKQPSSVKKVNVKVGIKPGEKRYWCCQWMSWRWSGSFYSVFFLFFHRQEVKSSYPRRKKIVNNPNYAKHPMLCCVAANTILSIAIKWRIRALIIKRR